MVNDNDSIVSCPIGPELLGRLLHCHAAALELYARQFCRYPDDVVQQAMLELVRQRTMPGDVVAWLYRVVRNKAISAARSARRRRLGEAEAAERKADWFNAAPKTCVVQLKR